MAVVLTAIFIVFLLNSPAIICTTDYTSTTLGIHPTSTHSISSSSSTTLTTQSPTTALSIALSTADCLCDLTADSCDIDCCCDNDCTSNELQLFSKCVNIVADNSISSFCINEGLIFRTSLSHSVLSGLFCVYTDNYPGRREFSSVEAVSSVSIASEKIKEFGNTGSNIYNVPSLDPHESEYYRSHDPIEVMFDNDALGILPLPTSLNGALCTDGNPVTYLNDESSTCSRYISPTGMECSASSSLNAEVFYTNFSVLVFPSSMQMDNFTSIPVVVSQLTCYNLIGELTPCDSNSLTPVYDETLSICNNTLLSLSYTIEHNATQGLMSVSAGISIGQVASGGYITQSFSVQFMYYNDSNSQPVVRPGNPGYIPHEPVLAGIINEDSIIVSTDSSNWLTVAMADDKGLCLGQRDSVTFKDSYRSSCILKVSLEKIFSNCEDLDTVSILLGSESDRINRLAKNGNANISDTSQWIELLGWNDSPMQIGCSNVVTGVQLVIFYTYTGNVSSPIATITGAQVKYLTQDIQQQCTIPSCSSPSPDIPIILESIVTFVPVYSPPDEVLLSTMISIRRLPHDFLYPLFTGSGSCTLYVVNIFIVTFSVLLSSTLI